MTGLPLVALVDSADDPVEEMRRFLFPLSSAAGAAATCSFLLLLFGQLGVGLGPAIGWTLAAAFATLMWPVGTSVFPQGQSAAFLTGGLLAALLAARNGRLWLAVAGGAFASLCITIDEYQALLLPWLALASLHEPEQGTPASAPTTAAATVRGRLLDLLALILFRRSERRAAAWRWWGFCLGALLGVALYMAANLWRHGTPWHSGKADNLPAAHGFWTNPAAGLLSLLISPGKGIIFYSPSVVLAIAGLRGLFRRAPALAIAVAGSTATLLLLLSPLAFFGGDWCWGPRYLATVLPLWCLAWPYALGVWQRHRVRAAILGLSFVVQLLAVSLDHHNFFYRRRLPPFFWSSEPWFYFHESALFSRPGELLQAWRDRQRPRRFFAPTPYRGLTTYCPFGAPTKETVPWMEQFATFHLPRPWPLWCSQGQGRWACPFPVAPTAGFFLGMAVVGLGCVLYGVRSSSGRPGL